MPGDLYFAGERTARQRFDDAARRIAADMIQRGVGPDDAVALLMRNEPRLMQILEAARIVGARYAGLNWHAAPREIGDILEDSGAKALYAHADLLEATRPFLPDGAQVVPVQVPPTILQAFGGTPSATAPDDLDAIVARTEPYVGEAQKLRGMFAYTSGSTGKPKGIRRTFDPTAPDNWLTYAGLARQLMGAQTGDRMFVSAPLYHSAPNALATFVIAAGDVDLFIEAKFDPESFLQTVDSHKITHAYVVPTMMVRLLKLPEATRRRYDVGSLRFMISTGAPCPVEIKQAMIEWFGPVLNESYGASELGFMTLMTSRESLERPGSVGRMVPGGEVKVLDDNGRELPPGEVGTLYIHLPLYGDFDYTNADGNLEGQRYGGFSTVGDVGYVDSEGYVYISDRKKDMIISGGANVFPSEIEAQLILMPDVTDCAVFGAPDAEFGETIVAAVTCRDGTEVTLESVRAFLEPKLARFKLPRIVDVHDSLPRQESGKIYKAVLREKYWKDSGRSI